MARQSTLKVLVVDDDRDWRAFLREFLESSGHQAFEACDGPQAVKRLSSERFDLVLLDLYMPGMNGDQVLGCVDGPLPRVVFFTCEAPQKVQPLKNGPHYYLPKAAGVAEFSLLLQSFASD